MLQYSFITDKRTDIQTYKNHSTANSRAIEDEGILRAANMMTKVTRLELGTEGKAIALTAVKNL